MRSVPLPANSMIAFSALAFRTSVEKSLILSLPPAMSRVGAEKLSMAAIAASGMVAVLSLYQLTPRIRATNSRRWGTPGKLPRAETISGAGRPKTRSATAAASRFFFWCSPGTRT